jgi:phage repressor protein C with HTH and peptisase S24 domain
MKIIHMKNISIDKNDVNSFSICIHKIVDAITNVGECNIRITGGSMLPTYKDGQFVRIVKKRLLFQGRCCCN